MTDGESHATRAPGAPDGEGVVDADNHAGVDGARQQDRERRRRRRPRRIAAVAVLVSALVVGGAGAGGELYTRSRVEAAVHQALPGLSADAEVGTDGLLLPQVLGGGLDSLTLTASRLDLSAGVSGRGSSGVSRPGGSEPDGLTLLDVDADVRTVGLSTPFPAGRVDVAASLGWDRLTDMVAASASGAPALTVQAGALGSGDDPGTVTASTTVLGVDARVTIVPSIADDGGLLLTVTSITVRGADVDLGSTFMGRPVLSYLGLESTEISVDADSLPRGLSLSRVAVTDGGLRVTLSGSDVELAGL